MKEPYAFVCGLVNEIIVRVFLCIQQAMRQQSVEVIVHLLRAKIRMRHYVRLFDSTCCRYQNIIYYVKLAAVLNLFLFLQCN